MERSEHQVTGFGRFHRDRDRLKISHFAQKDNVWVLAKCGAQRSLE
jgi:hypothetical protein